MSTDDSTPADPEVSTEEIDTVRTIKLPLETSDRKNRLVREVIDDWQSVASAVADHMPSFPTSRWKGRDGQIYRVSRRVATEDTPLYAHDQGEAGYAAQQAFHSWSERGQRGDRPSRFGDGDYIRKCSGCTKPSRHVEIVPNDRGYGLRVNLRKGEGPLWFQTRVGDYQQEYLEELANGDAGYGSLELHLNDHKLTAHLSVTDSVEVYAASEVETRVGVDLGENILYAAAVVGQDGAVDDVQIRPGREFRHQRERFDRRRKLLSEKGDLRGVRAISGDRARYTEHVTHNASREIVDLTLAHEPAVIHLEDLTGYRESAADPIHDWPQGMLREQIAYKARATGIPIREVDPDGTSITCRKCGQRDPHSRNGNTFYCRRCDYEVHADVNAAINIATRKLGSHDRQQDC